MDTQCPNDEELHRLCCETIATDREESLLAHISQCTDCQTTISKASDELAGYAPTLATMTIAGVSDELQSRMLKLKAKPAIASHDDSTTFEDLKPWLNKGASEIGRIGHYDLLRFLGRGGMGLVFEAHDTHLKRRVAVKVMSPSMLVDQTYSERFLREARAAASINHPIVVTIFEVSKTKQLPYMAMEFIEGESVQDYLDRGSRFDMEDVFKIGEQVADGLAAAHGKGVVHRDIKPANVLMCSRTGEAKITDFGLAYQASEVALTQTGTILGTPEYLSPEQVDGARADERSDLFSLGSLLYCLCLGRPPFTQASLVATLHQVVTRRPEPLADLDSSVPHWFSCLVEKLHERDPSDRIQSAERLSDILRSRVFGLAVTGSFPRTNHSKHLLGLCALGLAIVFGFASFSKSGRTSQEHQQIALVSSASELMSFVESSERNLAIRLAAGEEYHLNPLQLNDRSLRIVASPGPAPRLVFSDTANEPAISCIHGSLELHGIQIESIDISGLEYDDGYGNAPLLSCRDGELRLIDCDLVGNRRGCLSFVRSEGEVFGSHLETHFDAVVCEPTTAKTLAIRESILVSDVGLRIAGAAKGSVEIESSKFVGRLALEMDLTGGDVEPLSIRAWGNRFDCEESIVGVHDSSGLMELGSLSAKQLPFRWTSNEIETDDISVTLFGEGPGEQRVMITPMAM
ncbi:MAG: serine/threonine-protein kinase [Planctomycetota bacterium]